jgi:hypothetical protein
VLSGAQPRADKCSPRPRAPTGPARTPPPPLWAPAR